MKSMALSDAERKAQYGEYTTAGVPDGANGVSEGPKYPYGLELYLSDVIMAKLGLTGLPAVGTDLVLTATVRVTGTSERECMHGGKTEKHQTTDLQITAMELAAPVADTMGRAAGKLYPSGS